MYRSTVHNQVSKALREQNQQMMALLTQLVQQQTQLIQQQCEIKNHILIMPDPTKELQQIQQQLKIMNVGATMQQFGPSMHYKSTIMHQQSNYGQPVQLGFRYAPRKTRRMNPIKQIVETS